MRVEGKVGARTSLLVLPRPLAGVGRLHEVCVCVPCSPEVQSILKISPPQEPELMNANPSPPVSIFLLVKPFVGENRESRSIPASWVKKAFLQISMRAGMPYLLMT